MPSDWRHLRVPCPWGRMSVYVAGEGGPELLLLHGLGGSGRYWAGLAPSLAGRRRLIAPDLAGFGRSDKPDADYGRELHVDSLDRVLEALQVHGRITVAGHSMGGILGALYAARRPQRIDALALVASPFPRQQMHPYGIPDRGARGAIYRLMRTVLPLVSPLVRSPTFPQAVIADYLRHTPQSYQRTSSALLWDPTLGAELAGLARSLQDRPQLLLYSDEDRTIGPDNLGRWREVLPEAEVMVIPGAHQLLLRDHFATFADWLGGLSPGRLSEAAAPT